MQILFMLLGLQGSGPVILLFVLLEKMKCLKFSAPEGGLAAYVFFSCLSGLLIASLLVINTILLWPLIGLHALWLSIACYSILTAIGYFLNKGYLI